MSKIKEPVCSIKHFMVLTNQFVKIARRVIDDYEDSEYYDIMQYYADYRLKLQADVLLNRFKSSQHKTKICYETKIPHVVNNSFWLSYGLEKDGFKRSSNPTQIVFRIYCRIDGHRKKLLVRWVVPITWKNNE